MVPNPPPQHEFPATCREATDRVLGACSKLRPYSFRVAVRNTWSQPFSPPIRGAWKGISLFVTITRLAANRTGQLDMPNTVTPTSSISFYKIKQEDSKFFIKIAGSILLRWRGLS
ncbi:uncharacterized protein LOC120162643 [Hibiscus syriacus]|uniref:uncharacterized protein LOC120162643 n=1 Tax=Hibiscus syriacus TaxID=106335 RepID=UPI0019231DBD|nr:uncharacterized protein LOC120162643 [Hibiscus syriacus]